MVGWGSAYVPSAWLVEDWPPLLAAGARLTLAGAAAARRRWPLLGRPAAPGGRARRRSAWLALTQTVLFYGATFWGIAHAGAGLAAVLANTDPLFVAVLAAAVARRAAGVAQWLGLVVSELGGSGGGLGEGAGRPAVGGTRWWWWARRCPGASARFHRFPGVRGRG